MSRKFQDFMRAVEAEARREGPRVVAELRAFDAHFRLAGELLALRRARGLSQRQLADETGVTHGPAHALPDAATPASIAEQALASVGPLMGPSRRADKFWRSGGASGAVTCRLLPKREWNGFDGEGADV